MQVPGWMVTVPAGLLAVIGIIADKGDKLVGFLNLATAFMARLPLGVWSFVLSLTLSMLVWATAMRKVKRNRDGSRPHDTATVASLTIALAFTLGQQAMIGTGQGRMIQAGAIGLIAGLLAPFLGEVIRRVWGARMSS